MADKKEAIEIVDELLAKYDLLSVKAAFTIRELLKEIDRLEDIRTFYAEEQAKYSKPMEIQWTDK